MIMTASKSLANFAIVEATKQSLKQPVDGSSKLKPSWMDTQG
jgi:hypothetical protein